MHGVGGTVGAILTGVLAVSAVGGDGNSGLIDGNPHQVLIQLYGVGCTIAYDAVVSLILLKIIDLVDRPASRYRQRARRPRPQPARRSRAIILTGSDGGDCRRPPRPALMADVFGDR